MDTIAIKSNRIILPDKIISGYLIIQDGVIADIVYHIPDYYTKLVDVTENVVMPGVVDPHVHINEPGRTDWEGFDTATQAALAGGVTTLVDMPLNSFPVTTTVSAFESKLQAAENKLHANCGFWGGIVPGNQNEISALAAKGVLGFKAFLTHSGIDEFPNVTEDDLRMAMPLIVWDPLESTCRHASLSIL